MMKESKRSTPFPARALLLPILLLFCGCAHHIQHRTSLTAVKTTGNDPQYATATIEDGGSYVLGFVEFDDQGWLWSRNQLDAVMDRLREEDRQQRIVILTFVHGWKHNAKYDDSNVEMIRQTLRLLNHLERLNSGREGRSARKFVGVYAGWRGLSQKLWGLKNFSFWERKNTAHEVGRGALCELFLRLEDLRNISHILHAGKKNRRGSSSWGTVLAGLRPTRRWRRYWRSEPSRRLMKTARVILRAGSETSSCSSIPRSKHRVTVCFRTLRFDKRIWFQTL